MRGFKMPEQHMPHLHQHVCLARLAGSAARQRIGGQSWGGTAHGDAASSSAMAAPARAVSPAGKEVWSGCAALPRALRHRDGMGQVARTLPDGTWPPTQDADPQGSTCTGRAPRDSADGKHTSTAEVSPAQADTQVTMQGDTQGGTRDLPEVTKRG